MRARHRIAVVLPVLLAVALVVAPSNAGTASTKKDQARLNALGCNAGPVDGKVGTWTRSGVIRFQSANGIGQSGSLNATTRTKLYGATQTRCNARPVAGTATGRRIVISQRQNYVWLVRSGGTVAAQGPMVDNTRYLEPGTYHAGSKCGRSAKIRNNTDASGRLRLHNFVRFAPCGIGFHQIPQYLSNGAQIHADYLLGTNYRESHGCIRVSRSLSNRIWGFTGPGTKVVVL